MGIMRMAEEIKRGTRHKNCQCTVPCNNHKKVENNENKNSRGNASGN